MHQLSKDELLPVLGTWLFLRGHGEPAEDSLRPSLLWLRRQWELGNDHLPLDLVHDLGWLLLHGRDFRFASDQKMEAWSAEERAFRLAYEDRLLGRWALDPSLREAHIALAGLGDALRDEAVAHAVGLALSRPLRDLELNALGNAAHLKDLEKVEEALQTQQPPDPRWQEWALTLRAAQIEALIARRLFQEEDIWEIAHLDRLPSESARLGLRELHTAAGRIGRVPPSCAMHVQRKAREVPVDSEEADQYPAGGFDAISTQGRFENLVRSEIAYVGQADTDGVDLFDVRFAQNELLYYTRDESPMLDARVDLTFVIDRPFELRHKHPQLQAQTLVLVTALVLRLQADMVDVLGPAGSLCNLEWLALRKDDEEVAQEERALVELTLASELAHHRAQLAVRPRWREVSARGRIIFSPNPEVQEHKAKAWVRVGDADWQLRTQHEEGTRFDVRAAEGLRDLGDRLLRAIFE